MGNVIGRAAGVGVGLLLILVGFAAFEPDMGTSQSARGTALSLMVTALGIGVIGAAMLPNTIHLNGKDVKPLGIGLSASGGAAFFVISLIFLFYIDDDSVKPSVNAPADAEKPITTKVEKASGKSEPNQLSDTTEDAASEQSKLDPGPESERQQAVSKPVPAPQSAEPKTVYRYQTYCDTCCPFDPFNCAQVGFGRAYTRDNAINAAIDQCIENGGMAPRCEANVQPYEQQF